MTMLKKFTLAYYILLALVPIGVLAHDVSPDVLEADSIQPGCKLMVSGYSYKTDGKKYHTSLNWQCA
jgi:hypothetical protein